MPRRPEEQPQSTANASRKPPEIFRKPRSRSGLEPAAVHARKTEGPHNRPAERALELIASAAQAVNSDSRVRGMVGSLCSVAHARLWQDRTSFAVYIQRGEAIQQFALFRRAHFRVEFNNRRARLRLVRLPAHRLDPRILHDLMNAFQDARVALRRGHRKSQHTSVQADSIFDDPQKNQRDEKKQRGEDRGHRKAGSDGHTDARNHENRSGARNARDGAALAQHHTGADEPDARNNLSGDSRMVTAYIARHFV